MSEHQQEHFGIRKKREFSGKPISIRLDLELRQLVDALRLNHGVDVPDLARKILRVGFNDALKRCERGDFDG